MMLPRSRCFGALVLLAMTALATPRAMAQRQQRPRTPNDTLKSTEVAPDHKVTFRIYAPKASEVSIGGDFGGGKMSKDDKGVWSLTVGPLTPDFYSYSFIVNGVRTVDPKNPMIKPGTGGVASMFLVPGGRPSSRWSRTSPTARSASTGTIQGRSTRCGACTSTRRRATRARRNNTRCSTCSTAAATTTRAGARSAGPALSSTTCWRIRRRCR